MNSNQNNNSQSWTDPITGEIYPGVNPHASVQTNSVPRHSNVQVKSFRDMDNVQVQEVPTPIIEPMQNVYPQANRQRNRERRCNLSRVRMSGWKLSAGTAVPAADYHKQ